MRKSSTDLKIEIDFSKEEFSKLEEIIKELLPIKLGVDSLCNEDVNLFTADISLKFMLEELLKQNNELSIALKNTLISRIKERRNKLSDVLQYLFGSGVNSPAIN